MQIEAPSVVLIVIAAGAAVGGYGYVRKLRRGDYIRSYLFLPGLLAKLRKHSPELAAEEDTLSACCSRLH